MPTPPLPAFYDPTGLSLNRPGALLRHEVVEDGTGREAVRLLYTTSQLGQLRTASAIAAVPTGTPPPGGWPVVSIGHTTTGSARICAPSLDPFGITTPVGKSFHDWMLAPFTAAGMVAVATDYRGLGTPGPHPYLAGELEAMDLLDAARAVRQWQTDCGEQTLLWGHSQGGQASACAAETAAAYAPDLKIRAAVSAAPAVELVGLLGSTATSSKPSDATGVLMMSVWGWASVYPGIDLHALLTPHAMALLPVLSEQCLQGVVQAFMHEPPNGLFQTGLTESPWPELFARNTPGKVKSPMPLLVTQGETDTMIPPPLTAQFVSQLRSVGTDVEYRTYPDQDHFALVEGAMPDTLAWFESHLA